jgi:hypothetical protein
MINLMTEPGHEKLAEALETQLINELKEQEDPRMFGQGHIFDEYLSANKNERDFYNRFMKGENPRAGWVNKTDFEPMNEMKVINKSVSVK